MLQSAWRSFAALEFEYLEQFLTALLMFGWSTAVLAVVVQKTHSIEG